MSNTATEPASTSVHVLTYSHRHGTDVSVWTTHYGALLALYEIVMEYINDVEDRDQRAAIREAIKARNLALVSQLWAEAMEEGFDIDECAVQSDESSADLDAAIKASEGDDAEGNDKVLCEECGDPIQRDASEGVWAHGADYRDHDADENHVARPPEGTV